MAVTKLPLPQKCSPIRVTPFSSCSCSNSGPSASGGVSNRSSPRSERERPKDGRSSSRGMEVAVEIVVVVPLRREKRAPPAALASGAVMVHAAEARAS